jgi:hypothetical protein
MVLYPSRFEFFEYLPDNIQVGPARLHARLPKSFPVSCHDH